MTLPSKKTVRKLQSMSHQVSISAYVRLDSDAPEALQANRIRVKNTLNSIEAALERQQDLLDKPVRKIMRPLKKFLTHPELLWRRDGKTLALFVNGKTSFSYILPESIEEMFFVGAVFNVGPLKYVVESEREFFVLAVSHKQARIYRGTPHSIEPIHIQNLPSQGAQALLNIDEFPGTIEKRNGGTRRNGSDRFQTYGSYNPSDIDKNMMIRYFRAINQTVAGFMREKQAPLIFAGVEYLFPLYKSVNSYKHLIPRPLTGNYDHAKLRDIHKRALSQIVSQAA